MFRHSTVDFSLIEMNPFTFHLLCHLLEVHDPCGEVELVLPLVLQHGGLQLHLPHQDWDDPKQPSLSFIVFTTTLRKVHTTVESDEGLPLRQKNKYLTSSDGRDCG